MVREPVYEVLAHDTWNNYRDYALLVRLDDGRRRSFGSSWLDLGLELKLNRGSRDFPDPWKNYEHNKVGDNDAQKYLVPVRRRSKKKSSSNLNILKKRETNARSRNSILTMQPC
jgi:hypothetical protein